METTINWKNITSPLLKFKILGILVLLISFASFAGGGSAGYQPDATTLTISGGTSTCQYTPITLNGSFDGDQCANGGGAVNSNYTVQWYSNAVNLTTGGTPVGAPIAGTTNLTNTITYSYSPDVSTIGITYYYYVLTWTANGQGGCGGGTQTSPSTTTVTVTPGATLANAGPDQSTGDCSTTATLAGNTITAGTGLWTCTSGCAGVSITNPLDPTSTVTVVPGQASVFTWTATNGGCSNSDDVEINTSGPGCATYCSATFTNQAAGHISGVNFDGNNFASGAANYTDNTGSCMAVFQGGTYSLDITYVMNGNFSDEIAVYIDYNGDGDFSDTGEEVYFGAVAAGPGTFTENLNVTIDCDAIPGNLRMRIIQATVPPSIGAAPAGWPGGCPTGTYGNVEDYCLTVSAVTDPVAAAGPDQNISCTTSATLAGNAYVAPDEGMWTLVSGSGTFADPTVNNTTVSGLSVGANVFEWTLTGPCATSTDQVTINVSGVPNEEVNAGLDIYTCNASEPLTGSSPAPYTGQWVVTSGPNVPTFTPSDTDQNATIGNLVNGTYTIEWQVSTGGCGIISDAITLTHGALPPANAGGDQTICPQSAILDATPVAGITGTWTISGGGSLLDVNDPTTTAYNLAVGSYTATWTLTGGGCPGSTSDNITITVNNCQNPLTHDPNQDQTVFGCNFQFTDDGGTGADYSENVVSTQTVICPDSPDQYVTIDFTSVDLYAQTYDNIVVFDWDNPFAPIIGYADGTAEGQLITPSSGDPITSSYQSALGGCLMIQFTSLDASAGDDAGTGWIANTGCTTTQGTPITDYILGSNCGGSGGITLCDQTSDIDPETSFQGGQMDLNVGVDGNQGCLGSGETNEQWVYFNVITEGDIQFTFDVAGGQDFDFAIWGPYGYASCPLNTGDAPIRCSWAVTGNNGCTGSHLTGLAWNVPAGVYTAGNSTAGDTSEDGTGCVDPDGNGFNDGFVEPIYAYPGETYTMLINNYSNNNSSYTFDYEGTAGLGCDPPAILGVTLMDFSGHTQNRYNELFWSTENETNNSHFVIEGSTNGHVWKELGTVLGNGTTSSKSNYTFTDNILSLPLTYYRLKQVDHDGKFTYSQIIALTRKEVNNVVSTLFPNPSTGHFYFNYGGKDYDTPIEVAVFNQLGQKVYYITYEHFNKHVAINLNLEQLGNGLYTAEIRQGDNVEVQKISLLKE